MLCSTRQQHDVLIRQQPLVPMKPFFLFIGYLFDRAIKSSVDISLEQVSVGEVVNLEWRWFRSEHLLGVVEGGLVDDVQV